MNIETPRTAAHCIEYAHLIKWGEVHHGKSFDADDPEHMQWIYLEALKRAELFGITGVTYSLTQQGRILQIMSSYNYLT
ncbi:NEDD8-activating enzyme E1 catalytic subunit-like isoform X1 [Curcuma longa]|uniref:NEDD8-activating enzyme E1 catalytic subunit-like isoform X1 n=1 Tax=Curcuma longa TaxID=136217 RepID=UPI003D9F5203